MDNKNEVKGEKIIPAHIDVNVEIMPSNVDDGSMAEPSFNNKKQESEPSNFKQEQRDNNNEEEIFEPLDEPNDDDLIDVPDGGEDDGEVFPEDNTGNEIDDGSNFEQDSDEDIFDDEPSSDGREVSDGGEEGSTSDNSESSSVESSSDDGVSEGDSTSLSGSDEQSGSQVEAGDSGNSNTTSTDDSSVDTTTKDSSNDDNVVDDKSSVDSTPEPTQDSTSDTSSNNTSDNSTPSEESKTPDTTEDSSTGKSEEGKSNEKTDGKESKSGGKSDSKDDKSGGKSDSKDDKPSGDSKPPADDTAKKAKDAADKANDAAKNAEKAKDAADKGKELADKASDGAKNNSAVNKAKMAKNASDDAKRIAKEGLKAATDAQSFRHAVDAFAEFSPWGRAMQGALKIMDGIIGKDNTDRLLDKLGEQVYKQFKASMVIALISILAPVCFIIIAIYMIFAPMLDALMNAEKVVINMANTAEKFQNLYKNGNFADSKEAFYIELDRLGEIYGNQLDTTLLLATTFYTDMRNGYQTLYDESDGVMGLGMEVAGITNSDDKEKYKGNFYSLIKSEIDKIGTEASGTYDETTGYWYTVGKVYRLKLLANAMFNQTLFGDASGYTSETMGLGDWVEKYGGDFQTQLEEVLNSLLASVGKSAVASIFLGIPIPPIISSSDILDAKILMNCLFLGCLSIKSIDISGFNIANFKLNDIKINYYSYKFSEENYRKYLKEKYIPNNSDFKGYLTYDKNNNPTEESIDRIIDEIFEYKSYFDDLFLVHDEDDSEDYNKLCIGAIDRKLASALSSPVDINTKNCIEFLNNNGYGYTTDGKLHNGIELNKESTGNVEGDKVYAVMDGGTVKASSADGSMECTGGCIEISYKYSLDGTVKKSEYDFSIIYKGLSKASVTLKKDDTVKNQQQVGTIGTAAESEGLSIPSLYLEFRKQDGTAIDPTNMIVKCSGVVGDYPGAITINIPQTFKQYPEYSVTCVGSDGWHKSGGAANNYKCKDEATAILSPDKEVHDVWVKQGAKYKNGIAYITVDGVDRYLVAVVPREGEKGVGNAGDVLNATLADGTVLPLVVLDTKGGDKEYVWGHALGDGVDVIEFEVDMKVYNEKSNVASNWGIEWDSSSPVVKFTNNGNINSGTFDLKGGSTTTTQASGDLKLCDSMYGGDNTPSNLCGGNAEQKIWAFLLKKGYTKESASAIIGIWMVESNLIPNVVQRGKEAIDDAKYTAEVDNGTISKNDFVHNGPNGKGYGLAQWTYHTRKKGLYEYAKSKGKSIGDMQVQLEYLEKEMTTGYDWTSKKTKSRMNSEKTIEGAASIFFNEYQGVSKENFDLKHFSKRVDNAKGVYSRLKDFNCD